MADQKRKQQPLIQVRDLLIEFGNGRKKFKAVKGVTFDVKNGETFGLVGESGSGKTTVARAIMGMQPIRDGAVYFDGILARGKRPNLFKLAKAMDRNLEALIDNQISTTLKIDEFVNEYKRIYYKYLTSKYYDIKTGELRGYPDGVDRKIPEGVNLKNTKIVSADKENVLKQIYLLVNDSLKRLVKLVRISQKTTQFISNISEFIDLDPQLDKSITKYLKISQKKVLEVKEFENQVYFALQDLRKVRRSVRLGELTSIHKFFDDQGELIKTMIANHKEISGTIKSLNKDIDFIVALVSPAKNRQEYVKSLLRTVDLLQESLEDGPNEKIIGEYQEVIDLLGLKNINDALEESRYFAKPTKADKKNLKREMQMIFQDPSSSLNDRMAVEEIIGEGLINFPELYNNDAVVEEYTKWYLENNPQEGKSARVLVTKSKIKHFLILQQLESVGLLPEHLSRYPHEFSGGQRQRIGIARSLIMKPRFIVADEPISALDVSIRAQVLNLLRKFQRESNLTYIFIAHDLSVVRHIADRIAVIYRGDIVELASSEELFANPLHPYTKSLLTAIPLADPDQEAKKVHFEYDPEKEHPDYLADFPVWQEVFPDHFVYANEREFKAYRTMTGFNSEAKPEEKTDQPKKVVVRKRKPSAKTTAKPTRRRVKKKTSQETAKPRPRTVKQKKVVQEAAKPRRRNVRKKAASPTTPVKKRTTRVVPAKKPVAPKSTGTKKVIHHNSRPKKVTRTYRYDDWIGTPVKNPQAVVYVEPPVTTISRHKVLKYVDKPKDKGGKK